MSKTRVYIATTQGPAEVKELAPEQARSASDGHEIFSDVYLSSPFEKLPISAAYKDFVRKPSGVIEKIFEHPVFMMELSQRIAGGNSWKLGTFAAHALLYENKLARAGDRASRAIWLTGDLARDESLQIRSIEHLEQKLESSVDLFKELVDQGLPTTVYVPTANFIALDPEWLADWRKTSGLGETRVVIRSLDSAYQLAEPLDLNRLRWLSGPEGRMLWTGDLGAVGVPHAVETAEVPAESVSMSESSLRSPIVGDPSGTRSASSIQHLAKGLAVVLALFAVVSAWKFLDVFHSGVGVADRDSAVASGSLSAIGTEDLRLGNNLTDELERPEARRVAPVLSVPIAQQVPEAEATESAPRVGPAKTPAVPVRKDGDAEGSTGDGDYWEVIGYWDYDPVDGRQLVHGMVLKENPVGNAYRRQLYLKKHDQLYARPRTVWPVEINRKLQKVCANYPGYPSFSSHVTMPNVAFSGTYSFSECAGEAIR